MVLSINNIPVQVLDIKHPISKQLYNVKVKQLHNDLVLDYKHTSFYKENPMCINILRQLVKDKPWEEVSAT